MVKVITYGTYDLLHYGHIRLLERAKALGDYLIVGVTADDFDKTRGKINVQQSLMERVEAVKATGIADEVIIEEYEGQKIDDIRRYGVDIFTVGSDWVGKFDYLREYCQVVYLPRTEGISSSELRQTKRAVSLGLVGDADFLNKIEKESRFVNGIHVSGICTHSLDRLSEEIRGLDFFTENYEELLERVDAVYIRSQPEEHYAQVKLALERGRHVLCEAPMALSERQCRELQDLTKEKKLVLMDAIKTAYATAYARMLLLLKGGKIGQIVAVDATCTSLRDSAAQEPGEVERHWDGVYEWGTTALLPVLQLLGPEYRSKSCAVRWLDEEKKHDSFLKADFVYPHAAASIKAGTGVKSEGELVISGTRGYVYVPAPWWKTDYFEIRYENPQENKRYFYQLDGEGIRYELVAFAKAVETGRCSYAIDADTSAAICRFMEDFRSGSDLLEI